MGDDNGYGIIFGLGFFGGIVVAAVFIFIVFGYDAKATRQFKREAIERNFAEFDSKTGEWQWIEKK